MFNLPYIPTAQGLIDKAFRQGARAAKAVRSTRGPKEKRLKKSEEKLVLTTSKVIESDLKAIVKNFPSYEQLPEFYRQLLDIKIDKNRYKKSLGAVQWCLQNIQKLRGETIRNIRRNIRRNGDTKFVKEFLGRSASFIKTISGDLDNLIEIKSILMRFPEIEDLPTLVIAGYPNVGKSTFMRNLTGSKVKVATYPFTTRDILIGHKKLRYQKYQIIDSPGLLDRSMEDRNKIELQAILAMEELADVILFIIDPSMEIRPQLSLLREIRDKFTSRIFVVINKIDMVSRERLDEIKPKIKRELGDKLELDFPLIEISATNGEDCKRVFEAIFG